MNPRQAEAGDPGVTARPGPMGSPVQWSPALGRRIRVDGIDTLGVSTQAMAEQYLSESEWEIAADLAEYFLDEMTRINSALYTWLKVIIAFSGPEPTGPALAHAEELIDAMSGFGPGAGDLTAVLRACQAGDRQVARERLETMRIRMAAVHDQLVWWIQHLLTNIAHRDGEQAVLDVVLRAYEDLWKPRYAVWPTMTPLEKLQISVEGMRGHLSGPRHRGDVGIVEEEDRFTMILDPCGSCGVLRRGDPDSGRPGCSPEGTTERHDWAWRRLGVGWYAVHSAIVMEWIDMREGRPPMRPMSGCDTAGPCRWFIYKDAGAARAEHTERMGFDDGGQES